MLHPKFDDLKMYIPKTIQKKKNLKNSTENTSSPGLLLFRILNPCDNSFNIIPTSKLSAVWLDNFLSFSLRTVSTGLSSVILISSYIFINRFFNVQYIFPVDITPHIHKPHPPPPNAHPFLHLLILFYSLPYL